MSSELISLVWNFLTRLGSLPSIDFIWPVVVLEFIDSRKQQLKKLKTVLGLIDFVASFKTRLDELTSATTPAIGNFGSSLWFRGPVNAFIPDIDTVSFTKQRRELDDVYTLVVDTVGLTRQMNDHANVSVLDKEIVVVRKQLMEIGTASTPIIGSVYNFATFVQFLLLYPILWVPWEKVLHLSEFPFKT